MSVLGRERRRPPKQRAVPSVQLRFKRGGPLLASYEPRLNRS